jgi:HEAT repeat protein
LANVAELPPAERVTVIMRLLRNPRSEIRDAAIRVAAVVWTTDQIVALLREPADDALRNAGVEMLKVRGRDAVAIAIELLGDRDADIVLQAVLVLDHLRDPRALEPLRCVLSHANLNVVQVAIVAIGHLGTRAVVDDLVPFLRAAPWVQMAAVEALGDLRAPEAIGELAAFAGDPFIGPLAADAIARIGGPEALRVLGTQWVDTGGDDESSLDRLAHVAEGLVVPAEVPPGLGERLLTVLQASGETASAAARCALALRVEGADDLALTELVRGWHDHATLPACLRRRHDLVGRLLMHTDRRREWGFLLAAAHPEHAPLDAMTAALEVSGLNHLDAIAEALLAVGDERLGSRLVDLLARVPVAVRSAWGPLVQRHRAAIRRALANGHALSESLATVLSIATEEDPDLAACAVERADATVRSEALQYLSDRPDVLQRLPWLVWLTRDPDRYGSFAVAFAERAGLRSLRSRLRTLAQRHPHHELLRLLGRLRDRTSIPYLASVAGHGRSDLRPFAIGALGAIGGTDARRTLRELASRAGSMARDAYRALAECHTADDMPVFREAVAHHDWHVRMTAAEVLGRGGDPTDVALLGRLVADPVSAVAERARTYQAIA